MRSPCGTPCSTAKGRQMHSRVGTEAEVVQQATGGVSCNAWFLSYTCKLAGYVRMLKLVQLCMLRLAGLWAHVPLH